MPPNDEAAAWRRYFYPGTTVLRNRLDIRDAEALSVVEHRITSRLSADLTSGEIPIEGEATADRLSFIHGTLFGDIYDFAGSFRDVNMTKGGHSFGDHSSMGMYMRQIDRQINNFDWEGSSYEDTVDKLAELHTRLNFAHPAREGNGRTGRVFMEDIASQHGVELNFQAVDKEDWNQASAATFLDPGGLRLDPGPLQEIYHQIAQPNQQESSATEETVAPTEQDYVPELDYSALLGSVVDDPFDFPDPLDIDPLTFTREASTSVDQDAGYRPSAPEAGASHELD